MYSTKFTNNNKICNIWFSSVQSLSRAQLFATPWTAARQASLSINNSWSLLKLMSISRWCHPTISCSVAPFSSCLQSFPASGSFPVSQFFPLEGQSIGASASASVLPMNIPHYWGKPFWALYGPCVMRFSSLTVGSTILTFCECCCFQSVLVVLSIAPVSFFTQMCWSIFEEGPLQIICFLESRVLKTIVLYMLSDLCVGCFRQEGNSGSCLSILVRSGNISHYTF